MNENENAIKVINWWRNNRDIWELICGECTRVEFTISDIISILKNLVDNELYQIAIVLIYQLEKCKYMDDAIDKAIANIINNANPNYGVITECISEFEKMAIEKDLMMFVVKV